MRHFNNKAKNKRAKQESQMCIFRLNCAAILSVVASSPLKNERILDKADVWLMTLKEGDRSVQAVHHCTSRVFKIEFNHMSPQKKIQQEAPRKDAQRNVFNRSRQKPV